MLTISDERSFETASFGLFSRAIPLPHDAKGDGVVAEYKEGVPTVTYTSASGINFIDYAHFSAIIKMLTPYWSSADPGFAMQH